MTQGESGQATFTLDTPTPTPYDKARRCRRGLSRCLSLSVSTRTRLLRTRFTRSGTRSNTKTSNEYMADCPRVALRLQGVMRSRTDASDVLSRVDITIAYRRVRRLVKSWHHDHRHQLCTCLVGVSVAMLGCLRALFLIVFRNIGSVLCAKSSILSSYYVLVRCPVDALCARGF